MVLLVLQPPLIVRVLQVFSPRPLVLQVLQVFWSSWSSRSCTTIVAPSTHHHHHHQHHNHQQQQQQQQQPHRRQPHRRQPHRRQRQQRTSKSISAMHSLQRVHWGGGVFGQRSGSNNFNAETRSQWSFRVAYFFCLIPKKFVVDPFQYNFFDP